LSNPIEFVLAFLAGAATIASPCVLPVLPILLNAAVPQQGRARPRAIILGFIVSFSAFAMALSSVSASVELAQETLRHAALALLALSGLLRIWTQPFDWLVGRTRALWSRFGPARPINGTPGGNAFVIGLSLGAVWTPCAGPVLASILALVVRAGDPGRSALLVSLYALGAALPMLGLIEGGQYVTQRLRVLARHTATIQRVFGALVLCSAVAMYFQYDALLLASFPFPTFKGI
jgi:cytochrome c-type biogenesis protein